MIKTFGIVSFGLMTLSAGTVAVSIPMKDHITNVVTVAINVNGCMLLGFRAGKFATSKFVTPKAMIKIKGSSFNRVETT